MKKFIAFTSFILCIILFTACSSGDYGGDKNYGYAPDAGMDNGMFETDTATGEYDYEEIVENGFVTTEVKSTSTFSLDRNTASYTLMRKQINSGYQIAEDSVRIEEYVNYFSYDYDLPTDGEALALGGSLSSTPWNDQTKLFTVSVKAEDIVFENKKPNNLVFLIDTSGSMYGDDRLGLIQQAFTMLLENLDKNDRVSIVTYATGTKVVCEGLTGKEKTQIANTIQDLTASGATNGSGGIQLAYETAQKYFISGGNNRVLLATDGDFNVGISNKNALNEFISAKRDTGIYLSVFGVGMYNTSDTTMKTLAEKGNGNYGYIDSINEARKLLVNEMGGTLVTVAKDTKIQLTFNVETVQKYRLIGYESKMLTDDEFEDNSTDAGEIGSGHTVTAVYELILTENALDTDEQDLYKQIATAEVRYKDPDTNEDKSITKTYNADLFNETPDEDVIFIGCVVEYGLLLRNSAYKADASFESVITRLNDLQSVSSLGADEFRAEFKTLVQKAMAIYKPLVIK